MEKVLKVLLGTIGFGLIALFTARSTLAYPINLGITKLYDKQAFGIAFFMLILALPIIACAVVPAI
ncbi:MAG TPA: hypothetical protein DEA27_00570, partial [Candidatus Moranbacteria bacterium]|nr:hypothetical protein [Candidatus Moranbacteria bacterium]